MLGCWRRERITTLADDRFWVAPMSTIAVRPLDVPVQTLVVSTRFPPSRNPTTRLLAPRVVSAKESLGVRFIWMR